MSSHANPGPRFTELRITGLAAALALTGAAVQAAAPPAEAPGLQRAVTVYRCDDGRRVWAAYTGEQATLKIAGRTYHLATAMSASGARYVGDGLQWWTKGLGEGRLSVLKPGETVAAAPGVECVAAVAEAQPPADPKSPEAAVRTARRYFALLRSGQTAQAARLTTSGATWDFSAYQVWRAEVGAPGAPQGAAGSSFVEAPVTVHGRLKAGGPGRASGRVVLRRVNDAPGATPAQLRWRIDRMELGPVAG
jgi:membrane-bound inhibitor of C-type lysozyme